jgi:hypothetical protein
MSLLTRAFAALLATAAAFVPTTLSADIVRLKNGGEVRGIIERPSAAVAKKSQTEPAQITVRTLAGARLVLDRADIESMERRSLNVEEYERRARTISDNVDARWELSEWCRARSLKPQRQEQLERIVELDPNHEKAHYGLGHSRMEGRWIDRAEVLKQRGFVLYKGRYISAEEKDVLEQAAIGRDAELKWFKSVRLWYGWLRNADPAKNQKGLAELRQIVDPDAIPALTNFLWKDESDQIRQVYVNVLAQMPGTEAVQMLVIASLKDTSAQVRTRALESISQEREVVAVPQYVLALQSSQNEIVVRSAVALQKIGNKQAVPALIEALVTTHQYEVEVVDTANTYSFTTDGNFAQNSLNSMVPPEVQAGLLTGQYPNGVIIDNSAIPKKTRMVKVRRTQKNPEVLAALESLTGERYGYDEHTWRLWWSAQKTGMGKFNNVP